MQVSLALLVSSSALLLLQGCCTAVKEWKVLKNDATEILPEYRENTRTPQEATQASNGSNNNTLNNRAKHGGRTANTVSYSASELSCRELRSTRYITDGSCRSAKPVRELVCSGQCMPAHLLPNSIVRGKWWRSSATDYRCIPAHSRTRRVQLQCPNGNTRTYKIRVVTSCKCKRFRPHHNQSVAKDIPRPQRNKKHSRLSPDRSKNNTPLTGDGGSSGGSDGGMLTGFEGPWPVPKSRPHSSGQPYSALQTAATSTRPVSYSSNFPMT